jgi:hypothetical protein
MRLGILSVGGGSLADVVGTARAAEAAGLDTIHAVEGYRSAFVPLSLVDRLTLVGTARECAERLRDYCGIVDEAILLNVGRDASGIFEIKRELDTAGLR